METAPAKLGTNGEGIRTPQAWLRLIAGLVAVFALFQFSAATLGSERGEAGILVAAIVVGALIGIECFAFRRPMRAAIRSLGLGRPDVRGLAVAAGVSGLLLLLLPAFAIARGSALALWPGWVLLLPGLFAQAGIAEETLFRGYLFGHLSRDRSFWRAAALATAPFVAVHLTLFAVLAWPVALASVMLSAALSFPLSYLVLVGGRTIWAPALLHCVIQGALKVVVIPESDAIFLPLVWILASAIIPYSVFLVRLRPAAPRPVSAGDAQALP